MRRLALPTLALLSLGLCACARATPPVSWTATSHPKVEPRASCADCHRKVTPKVVERWAASQHGRTDVGCFQCHGTTGVDFDPRPGPDRCAGCHAVEVASVKGSLGERGCFACHAPHALTTTSEVDPHQP